MAENTEQSLPDRTKSKEAVEAAVETTETGEGAAPSKNALKKAAKEREKAEKAAKRLEAERKQKADAEANDTAKELYGKLETGLRPGEQTKLLDVPSIPVDKEITIRAYVHNARTQSAKLAFLDLRQEAENIQAVIAEGGKNSISRQMVKFVGNLNRETIVLVTGLVETPKEPIHSASISNHELHIKSCFVVAEGPVQLPMQVKDAMNVDSPETPSVNLDTRLNNRVLALRTPVDQAILAINDAIDELYCEYMRKNAFRKIHSSNIVGAATEGGSGIFELNYFGSKAYLAQSPQFFKQMAISAGTPKVFEVCKVFRAENSNTPRHLTEFTGLDFEMAIENTWEEVVDTAEDVLIYIFRGIRERSKYWMDVVQRTYPDAGNFKIPDGRAPRLRFAEGIKMLKDAGIEASEDEDISTTNEKTLGRLVFEKYNTDFYILTHYPIAARPFYTHLDPENPQLTLSYDAFMRGQEIVSGAQRIHDPTMLAERMRKMDPPLDPDSEGFRHYVDAFKMACPPHGGGGFGLNRITMLWLGLPNIRQATMFPRDPQRLAP